MQCYNWQFSRMKFEHFLPVIMLVFESKIEFINKNVATGNHLCLLLNTSIHLEVDYYLTKIDMGFCSQTLLWHEMKLGKLHSTCVFFCHFPWKKLATKSGICRWLTQEWSFFCTVNVAQQEQNPLLWGFPQHFLSFLPFSALVFKSLHSATLSSASDLSSLWKTGLVL